MPMPNLEPIRDEDLLELCRFLNENLSDRIPPETWARAFQTGWSADKPNNGFLVRAEAPAGGEADAKGPIVGAIGAIYADVPLGGRSERFCNITSWCVLDAYRSQSMRLAMAVVSQPGYHFTDLTPTEVVAGSLRFLKFRPLDTTMTVLPNLPGYRPGVRVLSDPDAIAATLEGDAARIYADHKGFPWLRHLAVGRPGAYCHVIYKPGTLKRLPSAFVLAVSDGELFLRYRASLGAHFLARGMVTTRVEARFLPRRPALAFQVTGFRDKMYRSDTLAPEQVTNLYSELMALDL
jgi:hypothetical protein